MIFGILSSGRFEAIVLLLRVPPIDAPVAALPARRLISLRPSVGSVDRPILASLPADTDPPSDNSNGIAA